MNTHVEERSEVLRRAAEHWTQVSRDPNPARVRWWASQTIWKHQNGLVAGLHEPGAWRGFHERLRARGPFQRAISIGCGEAAKEMNLLQLGIVTQFDLFEISDHRIRSAEQRAIALGVRDRVTFFQEDVFARSDLTRYELSYWNDSLHHMLDAPAAIEWSHDHLVSGGTFAMDDYVGPSRFQYTDEMLHFSTEFRRTLPPEFLVHPKGGVIPVECHRPSVDGMIAMDPTEAADSERILPSLARVFPDAEVIPTGGAIYSLALNDVLANLEEESVLLRQALLLDQALASHGCMLRAVAFAERR